MSGEEILLELYRLTAHELHQLIKAREVSSREITEQVLQRIADVDPLTRAYVTTTPEEALKAAEEVDRRVSRGEEVPILAGLPVGLKDNLCTAGIRTTCASKILENFYPPYDATVVARLKEAGAVIVGKCNMDEFAMGSSTENSGLFPTRNPWDLTRVPGGSSGGSAVAVAAGTAVYALGSDTGGSIRQPAAFCGVVGLKPTYGCVSRYGLVAFASSLDQIGPLTKDVLDCALVLSAIAGHDPLDSTSAPFEVPDYVRQLEKGVKGLRIGVPREYFRAEGLDRRLGEVVQAAIRRFDELGVSIEETSLPHTEYALPAYYIIAPAEASSNLARYGGVIYGYRSARDDNVLDMYMSSRSEGFGREVKRRIMLGTYTLSSGYYDAYYLKALKVRRLVKGDFDRAFQKFDALATPTTPTPPFKLGERLLDPLSMYASDLFTVPVNMAGLPAISVPCGQVDGLPIGLQLIGRPFSEDILLRLGYALETALGGRFPMPDLGGEKVGV